MLIATTLYYDFFCGNKVCNSLTAKLNVIAPVIGLDEKERRAIEFLNKGWYDVQDLDCDCFLTLFSKQKRGSNDRNSIELGCKA